MHEKSNFQLGGRSDVCVFAGGAIRTITNSGGLPKRGRQLRHSPRLTTMEVPPNSYIPPAYLGKKP